MALLARMKAAGLLAPKDAAPSPAPSGAGPSSGPSLKRTLSFDPHDAGGAKLNTAGLPPSSGEVVMTTKGLKGTVMVMVTASTDQEPTPLAVPADWTMRDFVSAAQLASGAPGPVTRLDRFRPEKPDEKPVELRTMLDVRNVEYEKGEEILVCTGGPMSVELDAAIKMSGAAKLLAGGLRKAQGQETPGHEMRRLSAAPSSKLWAKLQERVLDPKRPFYHFGWVDSFRQDAWVLMFYCGPSLVVGVILALLPLEHAESHNVVDGLVFVFPALMLLAATVSWFTYLWICSYFWVALPSKCMVTCVGVSVLFIPSFFLFLVNTISTYPLAEGPLVMMAITMTLTTLIVYPFTPLKLRQKPDFKSELFNSWAILLTLLGIFLLIKLFVVNLAGRNVTSLITLSFLYPILAFRGIMDASKMAEGYNYRAGAVVEAFLTFLTVMFQCIIFLSVPEFVSGWVIFGIINGMELMVVMGGGPLLALLRKKNRKMMAQTSSDFDLDHWTNDPLKLKPLLIKVYSTVASKMVFLVLACIIHNSYNAAAYPFLYQTGCGVFENMVYFTVIEACVWTSIGLSAEAFLRRHNQQYFIRDKKKALMDTAPIMALTCTMITVLLFLAQTWGGGSGDATTDATRLPDGSGQTVVTHAC